MNHPMVIILLVALSAFTPAKADATCEMVDNIVRTVSIVRDIQVSQNDEDYLKNISYLKDQIDVIDRYKLASPSPNEELSKDKKAVFYYVTELRKSVTEADAGYNEDAKSRLSNSLTQSFIRSLQSLEYHWDCRVREATSQALILRSTEDALRTRAPSAIENNTSRAAAKHFTGESNALSNPSQSGINKQATLNLGIVLKEDITLLTLLVLSALLSSLYYMRRRRKNYAVRDKRRRLNQTVKVSIAETLYNMAIVDISLNGVKIQHSNLIESPIKLRIHLGDEWHIAQVKWRNASFAGVKFAKPISPQIFNTVIQSYIN